jgi:hypothetical protein
MMELWTFIFYRSRIGNLAASYESAHPGGRTGHPGSFVMQFKCCKLSGA